MTVHLQRLTIALLLFLPSQKLLLAQADYTRYVNPFIGTDGHGHTFPGATMPFGMVQLSPDTRVQGWDACGGYHYSDRTVLGFSHTHLSGTGVADYGDILLMPTTGKVRLNPGEPHKPRSGYRSRFRHETERASPGFYGVVLDDYAIQAEVTATRRVGVHRYTFPASQHANVIIDLLHGLGPDRVLESTVSFPSRTEIAGFRRSKGWALDQRLYFVAEFSKPFRSFGTALNEVIQPEQREARGANVKAFAQFAVDSGEQIIVKVALSSVSIDGARRNLEQEVPGWDFDAVKAKAEQAWNAELGKIEVAGGSEQQLTTFYTALYHSFIAPNTFNDVDGRYRGMDGKIRKSDGYEMHTVFSLWDTFRAEHPLLTIINQKRTLDVVKSFLAKYEESGVLPVWELAANETWCMIGYHAVPVIVDAYVKGIRGFDGDRSFEAMKHSAMLDHFGLRSYRENGYIPGDVEGESVSKTLEYAYDDWCIAQMAKALGKEKEYYEFIERSLAYKNVFDASTGFMRAKINSTWVTPFDPSTVTAHYTEANAWQYSFFVPHDVDGLIGLSGGNDRLIQKLDALFGGASELTGRNQADITGLIGQYAQGNEPSHHVAYLYNYAAAPWKTQRTVRLILDSLFHARPDGLCGNDDCGQMSAWYVMSAMGFYQVTPGDPVYAIGSPLFKKVKVNLENGKQFIIRAEENSPSNRYIQSAKLNGLPYPKSYLTHQALMNGGELSFVMGPQPNPLWGSAPDDSPRSFVNFPFVAVPFVQPVSRTFAESTVVRLGSLTSNTEIHFTTDGSVPTMSAPTYSHPLLINKTTTIKAVGVGTSGIKSKVMTAEFLKVKRIGDITLKTAYSHQYTGGGDQALVDLQRGKKDFRLGAWQGYEGSDLDAIVDLGMIKEITGVWLGCLQDNNSWIFFPRWVEFTFSDDGVDFQSNVEIRNWVPTRDESIVVQEFGRKVESARARYVRVRAKSIGKCPPWHKGAGSKAWLFVDEITVTTRE